MKASLRNIFVVGLVGSLSLGALNARAVLEVSAQFSINAEADFYVPLESHGAWVQVGSYGRCWRPARIAVDWRPYCQGRWVWTNCGWYWESDEPWGWACYHYGRWVYDPVHFWVWVPGIEWGPAWVSWRVGGGYIGWAPLPPAHVSVSLAGPQFVFVASSRFDDPVRPSKVIINNTAIIEKTTVINNIRQETRTVGDAGPRKVFVNEGPGVDVVQKATGKKFKQTPIQEVASQTQVPAEIRSESGKAKGRNKRPDIQTRPDTPSVEQPKSAPERSVTPQGRPDNPAVPDKPSKPAPPNEHVAPGQVPHESKPAPPQKNNGSNKGNKPSKEKDRPNNNGKGHGKPF